MDALKSTLLRIYPSDPNHALVRAQKMASCRFNSDNLAACRISYYRVLDFCLALNPSCLCWFRRNINETRHACSAKATCNYGQRRYRFHYYFSMHIRTNGTWILSGHIEKIRAKSFRFRSNSPKFSIPSRNQGGRPSLDQHRLFGFSSQVRFDRQAQVGDPVRREPSFCHQERF